MRKLGLRLRGNTNNGRKSFFGEGIPMIKWRVNIQASEELLFNQRKKPTVKQIIERFKRKIKSKNCQVYTDKFD